MPSNSIAFACNYTSVIDEVYQRASVSGVLNSGRRMVRAGHNAKGRNDCNLCALLLSWNKAIGAQLYCYKPETYQHIFADKAEVDQSLEIMGSTVVWDDIDADKKTRTLTIKRAVDFTREDAADLHERIVKGLFALRNVAMERL